jgi:hypothetical protein
LVVEKATPYPTSCTHRRGNGESISGDVLRDSTDKAGDQVPIFKSDTDGSKPKSKYVMGRRNWCEITLEETSGDLSFDIRVEKTKGYGETVG